MKRLILKKTKGQELRIAELAVSGESEALIADALRVLVAENPGFGFEIFSSKGSVVKGGSV